MKHGYIDLDQGSFRIGPETKEDEFVASSVGAQSSLVVANKQYRTYKTPTQTIFGRSYVLGLSFESGGLRSVRLCPAPSPDEPCPSWVNYSEVEQLKKKAENDRWLLSVFGTSPPYVFPWGSLQSVFDDTAGSSVIIIRYEDGNSVS
jgi:hypothetical protein